VELAGRKVIGRTSRLTKQFLGPTEKLFCIRMRNFVSIAVKIVVELLQHQGFTTKNELHNVLHIKRNIEDNPSPARMAAQR